MLLEKITAKDVQIGLAAADWEDAIRQAAAPLRDAFFENLVIASRL